MLKGKNLLFLKDTFLLGVTAFGGPQAHIAMMLQQFVRKRNYITEEELMEALAFSSMLPGPSSTQTLLTIALKRGGTWLALLALLVWVLPAAILMTALTLAFTVFEAHDFSLAFLIFVQPMAIGFILFAAYKIGRTVVKNIYGVFILLLALFASLFFNSPLIFPIALFAGGFITNISNRNILPPLKVRPKIDWRKSSFNLLLLILILTGAAVLGAVTQHRSAKILENFLRFGSITFGGGSVLVPMMFEQFVKHRHYVTANEFISGYALNQAIPGPAFAFATFTGGMSLREFGLNYQVLGCFIGTIGIFLPGTLILFFIYPLWEYLKSYRFIQRSLEGINAAATGLVLGAAVTLYINIEFHLVNIFVIIATFCLLYFTKLQAPILVFLGLLAGFIYSRIG
ncbi:MAG: chromate efflux transporter [Bacteroidota bacterium]